MRFPLLKRRAFPHPRAHEQRVSHPTAFLLPCIPGMKFLTWDDPDPLVVYDNPSIVVKYLNNAQTSTFINGTPLPVV